MSYPPRDGYDADADSEAVQEASDDVLDSSDDGMMQHDDAAAENPAEGW